MGKVRNRAGVGGALVEGAGDLISVMLTISCEVCHAFDYFNWVGFCRLID